MLEREENELLQDYRYRRNILQEITLDDIDRWNNMEADVDWDKITNKPTTLEGYGITDVYTKDEIQDNTLNKFKAINGKVLVDTGFNLGLKDGDNLISYNYGTSGAPTLRLGSSAYISSYMSNMDIVAPTQLMLKTGNLNLKTKLLSLQGSYGSFSVDVSDNKGNNKLYASIPAEFTDIVKAPRLNIYSGNNTVLEGALWNSTYNINGAIKDGLHLSHENGKYLALAYKNASTGIYNSYMIFDVEGVLKNDSDGDDWGPVRFEQNVFFRHGLKIGGGEDIILAGKGVNTRIAALENAITQGTGMVEWNNVLNKPSTFTPSSHTHDYLPLSGGAMNGSLKFGEADGRGINFWNSGLYSIYMSSADNATYGGRLWETTSDYNMYFKMTGGTNRGFVFKNDNTVLGGFDGNGILRAMNAISTKNIYFGGTDATAIGSIENGNITIANNRIFYSMNTNGEKKNLMQLNAANVLCVGNNGGGTTLIVPNASADALVRDCSEAKNYKIWNEKNFNPNNYMPWSYNNIKTGSAVTNFRGLITGNSGVGGFLKSFRKEDGSDGCMPMYGSGVAWGQGDTHGFIYTDYGTARAYVGGGSNNRLLWAKEIAWKDDLTSYLPLSGGAMNGSLTFANGKGIYGKDTNGTAQRIAVVGADNCCYLGGVYLHTYIRSSDNPQYLTQDGKKYNLFHEGNFNPNTYTPKSLKQFITSWSSSENSQWTKIADINVESTNGISGISFIVHSAGSNSSNHFAIIVANIKQINAMGTAPTATLYMPLTKNLSTSNVVGVITSNTTTKKTMSIYIKIPTTWSAFGVAKLTGFGTTNLYESQTLLDTLPSGTQIAVS